MRRVSLFLSAVVFVVLALPCVARADTFMLDVADEQFTLYTDPNSGNEIKLGGLSGICPVPEDRTGKLFYVVNDRGPGGDYQDGKFFAVPDYTPSILTVKLKRQGVAEILNVLPLRKPNGDLLKGIPNPCVPHADPIVDLNENDLSDLRDPDNLDPEGITTGPAGNFWMCGEFRPSIFMVTPAGKVVLRLVPEGTLCGSEQIPTFDVLPGILGKRKSNKGLEGITMGHGGILFAAMQRPVESPDGISNGARHLRFLKINLLKLIAQRPGAIQQLVYVTEDTDKQKKTYASSLFAITNRRLVVAERRTDKVYVADLAGATDVTGLEDADGYLLADPTRTLEELAPEELADFGIRPIQKTVILDSITALDPLLAKCEGVAIANGRLVFCADNDFNIDEDNMDWSTTPATLALQDPPNMPRIVTTRLPRRVLSD